MNNEISRNDCEGLTKEISQMREKVLQAEQERIEGKEILNVSEARKGLRERLSELEAQ